MDSLLQLPWCLSLTPVGANQRYNDILSSLLHAHGAHVTTPVTLTTDYVSARSINAKLAKIKGPLILWDLQYMTHILIKVYIINIMMYLHE